MPRTLSLKTGDPISPILEVDVINLGTSGIILQRGGSGPTKLPGVGENDVIEKWTLNFNEISHNAQATQWQNFRKLLKRAPLFKKGIIQKPVYIHAQTTGEDNPRYSLVKMALELEHPDVFDLPFEAESNLEGVYLSVVREKEWRGTPPGVLPSPMVLGETDGPAESPTEVFVTNHQDDAVISHIFCEDTTAATFSTNLAGDATGFDLFNEHTGATPVAGDAIYFGADDPFFCTVLDILTAFDGTATFLIKYFNDTSFVDTGTKLLMHPEATIEECLKTLGKVAFSWGELSDWATTAVNGVTKLWIKLEVATVTSWNDTPAQDTVAIYNQSKNYIEIPASSWSGDENPIVMTRVRPFHGGDENADWRNISRLIMAVNSDKDETAILDKFVAYIPLGGNGHPADWSITNVTDASSVSDPEAPGGQHCAVDFGTNTTMEPRVRATGTGLLPYFKGEFRVFLHYQQIGGAAGDTRMRLRSFLSGIAATDPAVFSPAIGVKSRAADVGPDLLTLGLLRIPFADVVGEDTLPAEDIAFEVQAEQISPGATLELLGLLLFPVKEGSISPDDPVTDNANGRSALRGGTALDIDPGVLAYRMQKHLITSTGALFPVETWTHKQRPPRFENADERTRIYFLMMGFTSTNGWGFNPMTATIGQAVHVQVYPHWTWSALRGAD